MWTRVRIRRCSDGDVFLNARQLCHPHHPGLLFSDFSVRDPKNSRPCEMHFSPRIRGKISQEEIGKGCSDMGPAALQMADDVVALCHEVRRPVEFEIVKRLAQPDQESL